METQTEQDKRIIENIIKWFSVEESEEETKEFNLKQADENINNLLVNKPRADKVKKEMSEFVKGLK